MAGMIISEMACNVSSAMLNLTQLNVYMLCLYSWHVTSPVVWV